MTSGDWGFRRRATDERAKPFSCRSPLWAPTLSRFKSSTRKNKPAAQEQLLTVNRVVAVTGGIPAAQTDRRESAFGSRQTEKHPAPHRQQGASFCRPLGQASFTSARELSAGAGRQQHQLRAFFRVEYPERIELNLCVGSFPHRQRRSANRHHDQSRRSDRLQLADQRKRPFCKLPSAWALAPN